MKFTIRRKNIGLLVTGLLLVIWFFMLVAFAAPSPEHPVNNLTSHWRVTLQDGSVLEDMELAGVRFGGVTRGNTVVLENTLPSDEVIAAALQLKTSHVTVRVFSEDTLLYEDGAQYPPRKEMTPGRFHFVELPSGYGGKPFSVSLTANEDAAFTGMEPVLVGNIDDLYRSYLLRGRVTLTAGLFLCVMGILLFLVFFYLNRYHGLEPRLLCSAMIALLLGVYLLSYYKLTSYLTDNFVSNDFAEYVALFFLPYAFVTFLATTQEGGRERILYVLSAVNYIVAMLFLVLHASGLVMINRFTTVIHVLIMAEGAFLILLSVVRFFLSRRDETRRREWKVSERIWVVGFFVMLLAAMIDVLRYSILHYFGGSGAAFSNLNVLTVGALFFVATIILNFFYYHVEKVYSADMMQRLSGLAYTDPLTDMANRGRCEQILQEVDKSGGEFMIVSLDIDRLKQVNDTYGHPAGDQYLAEMAEVLNIAFKDADLLGRMGGDEFLAMLRGTETKRCEAMLRMMEDMIAGLNRQGGKVRYSISYGYATSKETAYGTTKAVYRLADARMYRMKNERHKREVPVYG